MTVSPIPYEPGRFYVQSRSRPDMQHIVDLFYRGESGREKPKKVCSCEDHQCKNGKVCAHLEAVVTWVIGELEKKGA